jgi:hypothetical protein
MSITSVSCSGYLGSVLWPRNPESNKLTNCMELRPSLEAISCAATQEFRKILCNTKVYYRAQKSLPLGPILSQINPVHTIPSYLSKINFNVILPPTSKSSYWFLSFWLSHKYSICILFSPILQKMYIRLLVRCHLSHLTSGTPTKERWREPKNLHTNFRLSCLNIALDYPILE